MGSKRACFTATTCFCLTGLFFLFFNENNYRNSHGDGTHMTRFLLPPPAALSQQQQNTSVALPVKSNHSNDIATTQPVRGSQSPPPATAVAAPLETSVPVPPNSVTSQSTSRSQPPSSAPSSASTALPTLATTRRPGIEHKPPDPLPCNWTTESLGAVPTRKQGYLECSKGKPPTIAFREVPSNVTPALWSVGQDDKACLKWFIRDQCLDRVDGQKIPRVAHVVRFGNFDLRLDGLLGLISVARIMKPCVILLHSDVMPSGPNLQALLQLVPYVLHVPTQRPRRIFDRVVNVVEHSADISRIRILLEYGGVYLDMDYLIVNPLDDLYNQSAVLGQELDFNACNGFLLAEPESRFMSMWLQNYTDFQDGQWATHSGHRSFQIAKEHPEIVRLVRNFHHPHYAAISAYFSRSSTPKNYDYKKIYGLHLYSRMVHAKLFASTRIDRQDNVIGDIVRYIIYNDDHACVNSTS